MDVGGYLFGIVIWADCFVLLEHSFLCKMVGTGVVIEVVVGVVVVETEDMVGAWFFIFFRCGCFGYFS